MTRRHLLEHIVCDKVQLGAVRHIEHNRPHSWVAPCTADLSDQGFTMTCSDGPYLQAGFIKSNNSNNTQRARRRIDMLSCVSSAAECQDARPQMSASAWLASLICAAAFEPLASPSAHQQGLHPHSSPQQWATQPWERSHLARSASLAPCCGTPAHRWAPRSCPAGPSTAPHPPAAGLKPTCQHLKPSGPSQSPGGPWQQILDLTSAAARLQRVWKAGR